MSTALRVALIGGILAVLALAIVYLVGFHVITLSKTMTNCIGLLLIVGIFLLAVGAYKGLTYKLLP